VTRQTRKESAVVTAAREYLRRGWCPIGVEPNGKVPKPKPEWEKQRLVEVDLPKFFSNGNNIGIHFGTPSNGVVDVDLDCTEALALADYLLPATESVFGRNSKPRSHRLYRIFGHADYLKLKDPLLDSADPRHCLVELRQDGHQTIVPPSEADGEIRFWDKDGEPAQIQAEILSRHVNCVGAASLLVRYWPASDRHEARMALSGCLARGGWTAENTIALIQAIIRVAQPGECEAYSRVSGDTRAAFSKVSRKEPVTGFTRLSEMIHKKIVEQVCDWLQIRHSGDGSDGGSKGRADSAATAIINLARSNAELFHFGEDSFGTIHASGHLETYSLRSRAFRSWLSQVFFRENRCAATGEALASAIGTLDGFARFECPERETFIRVAGNIERLWIDLGDPQWRQVEVDSSGWRITEASESPVRFRRAHGMLSLPLPERGGSLNDLRDFVNVGSDGDFQLLVGVVIGALRPCGPYPILVLHGEQGSAKSTTTRVLRSLIDPSVAPLRSEPRDVRDLMIGANNGWMIPLDNISRLEPWLSDCLCRLSTGGGFSTRTLYSDAEETIFQSQRPVILNGIEELAVRGDLLDRCIVLDLPRIEDAKRRDEHSFKSAFDAARAKLFGALLDAVSAAIRNHDSTVIEDKPRMADFARWVVSAEAKLGWKPGEFLIAYRNNRRRANELVLETPLAEAVRKIDLPWKGTATELLKMLSAVVDEPMRKQKAWPSSGRMLSNALRRLAPNLRPVGVLVEFADPSRKPLREPGTGRRLISLSGNSSNSSSQTSYTSKPSQTSRTHPTDYRESTSGCDVCDDEKHPLSGAFNGSEEGDL
jgi:hypothetical protein